MLVMSNALGLSVPEAVWNRSNVAPHNQDESLHRPLRSEIISCVNNRTAHQMKCNHTKRQLQEFCTRSELPSTGTKQALATGLIQAASGDRAQHVMSPRTAMLVSID